MDELEYESYLMATSEPSWSVEARTMGRNRFFNETVEDDVCSDSSDMEADYISRYPQ